MWFEIEAEVEAARLSKLVRAIGLWTVQEHVTLLDRKRKLK